MQKNHYFSIQYENGLHHETFLIFVEIICKILQKKRQKKEYKYVFVCVYEYPYAYMGFIQWEVKQMKAYGSD